MSDNRSSRATASYVPTVDLNEACFDHPSATFIFQLQSDLAIVDQAAIPDSGSLVIVETDHAFIAEHYHGQRIFGVITHLIHRIA